MNKNKKRLSRLLIPMLALSGVNMDAMETVKSMKSWKLPLSDNIPRDNKNRFVNPDAQKKWYDVDSLMTIGQLRDYLNKHRCEIFHAMHQGDPVRAIENGKIGRTQKSILNAFKKWHNYTKKNSVWAERNSKSVEKNSNSAEKNESADKTSKSVQKKSKFPKVKKWTKNVNWRIQSADKMKELVNKYTEKGYNKRSYLKDQFVNNLSFPATDGYKKNWAHLGRGPLHESGHNDENVLQSELWRAERGDVNCTIWASLINWFLNENGYPAQMYHRPGHEFVVAPVTGENKKGIYLCYIGVDETKDSLDTAEIFVDPLCTKKLENKVWLGTEPTYRNNVIRALDKYSPTFYQYLDITQKNKTYNTKQLTAITHGLQSDLAYWHKKGEIKTDMSKKEKIRTYPLKILPRDGCAVSVPLNLEYLDQAVDGENGKKIYTKQQGATGTKDKTNLIYIDLYVGEAINKGTKMPDLLENNLKISINPTQDKNKSGTYTCKWEIPNKYSKWSPICSGYADIKGLDTPIDEAVAFWNDPNYKDPVTTEKK